MKFGKALLVFNGNAGQAEIRQQLGTVTGILGPELPELTLLPTQEPGHAEALCRERGGEFELVLLLGGDGTVHEGVNGLAALKRPPVVGILPAGTCNDFSRALGLPQQLDKAAEAVLAGRLREVDIGKANGRYFSNFYGIGLITDTSENVNPELKGMFGKISYVVSALQRVTRAEPFPFRLETEQGVLDGDAVMILAANGTHIGTNPLPLGSGSLSDGLLDIFVVREAGLPLLRELLASRKPDWRPESSTIDYVQVPRAKLETPAEPMRADTDGETYQETPVLLEALPGRLTFVTGER